jgi:hypothetical protein
VLDPEALAARVVSTSTVHFPSGVRIIGKPQAATEAYGLKRRGQIVRRRGEQTAASSTLLRLRARHLRDELPDGWFAEKGLGPRAAHEIRLAICRWTELSPRDQEVIEKILAR